MGRISITWGSNRKAANAAQTPAKKGKRYSSEINKAQPDRTKFQMNVLREAIESAEQPDNPDWSDLLSLYKDTLDDDEVIAQNEIATDKLEGEPFAIAVDGTDNDDLTKLFKGRWFTDFLDICYYADLYGYQLAEAGQFNDEGKFKSFTSFPPANIKRNKQEILINTFDQNGIPYAENATQLFLIEVGDPSDLGLLKTITKLCIQKNFAEGDWDRYNEKYNVPHIVIGTDADGDDLNKLDNAAKNFSQNSYLVGDLDVDQIKLLEATGAGSAYKSYKDRIDDKNKAIAKIINGQQATTENQAYTGTAQVQQQTYIDKHTSRLRRYSNIINDQLMPFLRYHGYQLPENAQFRFPILDDVQATPIEDNPENNPDPANPQNSSQQTRSKKKSSKSMVAATDDWLRRVFEKKTGLFDQSAWESSFKSFLNQIETALQITAKTNRNSALYRLFTDLQADSARFAAFREYQLQNELQGLITDNMDFTSFKKKANKVTNLYSEYKKTEDKAIYDNSVSAKFWSEVEDNADIYPNIERRTAGDSDVRASHADFEGLVLPWNHPFWRTNSAPMDFGCRCDDIQTDAPVNELAGINQTISGKGFDFNPYFDRKVIADSAGYYTNAKKTDVKELEKLANKHLTTFLNK